MQHDTVKAAVRYMHGLVRRVYPKSSRHKDTHSFPFLFYCLFRLYLNEMTVLTKLTAVIISPYT